MKTVGLAALFVLLGCSAAAAPALKTVIGENMSAPWYLAGRGLEPEGIIPDYLRAIEKELKRDFQILVLPKFRIQEYFLKKKIDLNCYTSQEWAQVLDSEVHWSDVIFTARNIIVSNTGPVTSLNQFNQERIGTVLKYRYPKLQVSFQLGKMIRDDSPNEEANIQKLESSRYKYALVDSVHLAYYLKSNPRSKIHSQGIKTEEIPVRCWLRRDSPLKISELNRAIAEVKSNGTLDRIFGKYK